MQNITTENIAEFGYIERDQLITLLQAWQDQGLPDDFYCEDVRPMMNKNSGNVFLTNSEYQVAMMNGDKLESFYSTPYEGVEGFYDELMEQFDDLHPEDQDYLADLKAMQEAA